MKGISSDFFLVLNSLQQKVLIIGTVWPEPTSSAAGSRMMQIIQLFIEHNCSVTFCSTASTTEHSFNFQNTSVSAKYIALNNESFDTFIAELVPNIVVFDRFMIEEQFGWRVSEICPNAMRILDTEDLHCLRWARQQALKNNTNFTLNQLFSDVAKREIASIYRCDLSLIISEYEMQLLNDVFKIPDYLIYYLPFLLTEISDYEMHSWKTFDERKNFVFIGNFLHAPNYDAIIYLKNEIWPLIRKSLPNAEVNIYGAYASGKVMQLNNIKQGFNVLGRAASANIVLQNARVSLAPLRFGAGIKGKLIDAMCNGTPNVTTSIGAESMQHNNCWSGLIANNATEFAFAATTLYTNQLNWAQFQKNGITIINNRYSKTNFGKLFFETIEHLLKDLNQHRLKNFTGSMLLHHSISGTKYMSRWIEEKNKLR